MYTLSCLQVAYDFLNREWIYLIYGDQKKTCYRTLKSRIGHFYCYLLNLINPKDQNEWHSKENYKFLIIVIVSSLGVIFTAYKVMKILLSPEVKKSIMKSQWQRNENTNKMCPAFHENNNGSAQMTDISGGTSLTAIVKPTIRNEKISKSLDLKCDYGSSDNDSSLDSDIDESPNNIINAMNFAGNLDFMKPLVKCTSSLRVVTSNDSLNEELLTGNSSSQNKENGKRIKMINEINNNLTVQDSSSVFEVDECVLSARGNSSNPYQKSAFMSPDTLSLRKNSSYASGHFVENFPDLDLSPILNVSPKNKKYQKSVTTEFTDKEITDSKDNGKGCSHQKDLSDTEHQKNVSNSTLSAKCLEKSSDSYFSCWDFQSFLSSKKTPNRKNSKIPKLNLSPEEEGLNVSKLNTSDVSGSKIPIPLRKSPISNVSADVGLNELFKKPEAIQPEKSKDDNLQSMESELSLERFVQLEIATGCCSGSHFKHRQLPVSKS